MRAVRSFTSLLLASFIILGVTAPSAQAVRGKEFPTPTAGSAPTGIAAGPDGAMWFTEAEVSNIGRITTGGTFTEFPIPTAASFPNGIASSPRRVWFTESAGSKVGALGP